MSKYIFLIVGESGSGKTTIANELEERYGLKQLQSYTTRPKRYENEAGHIFITDQEFDSLNGICAYTMFNGHKYCATSKQVDESDLYIIDPYGIDYFRARYTGDKIARIIYIECPEKTRFIRMIERGDTGDQALGRILNDRKQFKNIESIADLVIDNNINKESSIKIIEDYITKIKRGE